MSWLAGLPQARWEDRERDRFLREVYTRLRSFDSFTWNPPSVGANTTVDTTLTTTDTTALNGLRVGQVVHVSPPSTLETGLVVGGSWVALDNTLTIRLGNLTASSIDPASGTWSFSGMVI